jgi:AcrR family transcriptional regulator
MLGELNGDRVTRRRAAAREEILSAAWDLAAEHGIGGFSLRDLAQRVGMRAPSLYGYFASKAAIYDAMFRQAYVDLAEHMRAVEPDPDDVAGSLACGARLFLDFCRALPARYQLMFARPIPGYEPSPDAYAASLASMAQVTDALADLGITANEDVDLWISVTAGLAAQQLSNDPAGDRWVQLTDEAAQMFVTHHRARSGT